MEAVNRERAEKQIRSGLTEFYKPDILELEMIIDRELFKWLEV